MDQSINQLRPFKVCRGCSFLGMYAISFEPLLHKIRYVLDGLI